MKRNAPLYNNIRADISKKWSQYILENIILAIPPVLLLKIYNRPYIIRYVYIYLFLIIDKNIFN